MIGPDSGGPTDPLLPQYEAEQAAQEAQLRAEKQATQRVVDEWHRLIGPEQTELAINEDFKELRRRKEAGTLDPVDYSVAEYYELREMGLPLSRKELGKRAFVISLEELEGLDYIEIVLPGGGEMVLEAEDLGHSGYGRHPVIMFPENFGDLPSKT